MMGPFVMHVVQWTHKRYSEQRRTESMFLTLSASSTLSWRLSAAEMRSGVA